MSSDFPGGTTLLLGRNHHEMGELARHASGRVALCLSRGGARKTYSHTDPNEDAALISTGEGGWLLAVADGHHGESGSQATLQRIASEWAPRWVGSAGNGIEADAWQERGLDLLQDCEEAVLRRAAELGVPPAPTTLSLALIRPLESFCAWACMGDSHLFVADEAGIYERGWPHLQRDRCYFLGYEASSREALARRAVIGSQRLDTTRAVVLATDGLSEKGIGIEDPAASIAEALRASEASRLPDRPLELIERVAEAAMAAQRRQQAGDNIACSLLDLRP